MRVVHVQLLSSEKRTLWWYVSLAKLGKKTTQNTSWTYFPKGMIIYRKNIGFNWHNRNNNKIKLNSSLLTIGYIWFTYKIVTVPWTISWYEICYFGGRFNFCEIHFRDCIFVKNYVWQTTEAVEVHCHIWSRVYGLTTKILSGQCIHYIQHYTFTTISHFTFVCTAAESEQSLLNQRSFCSKP